MTYAAKTGVSMTRQEIIERLCSLQAEVATHIGYAHAADCFCGKSGFWDTPGYAEKDYRNDGVAIEFIEKAVQEKIARESE